jgi:hypothetical protein
MDFPLAENVKRRWRRGSFIAAAWHSAAARQSRLGLRLPITETDWLNAFLCRAFALIRLIRGQTL